MALAFVQQQGSTWAGNNGSHVNITYGSGGSAPTNGNLALFLGGGNKGSLVSWTDPAGSRYTSEVAQLSEGASSGNAEMLAEYRIISSDSGVADQWTISSAIQNLGAILEYSGQDSTINDVSPVTSNTNSTSLAGITTVTDGCRLIYACVWNNAGNTITASAQTGWTQRVNGSTSNGTNDMTLFVQDFAQTTHGASGTVGPTFSSAPSHIVSMLIALRPAGASVNPSTTDSITFSDSSSVSGSNIPVSGVDSAAFDDTRNDINIVDLTPDATLTDLSLGNSNPVTSETITFTDTSAVAVTPAALDSALFSETSAVAVLGTSPSTSDLFHFLEASAVGTSSSPGSGETFSLFDIAEVLLAGSPHASRTSLTFNYLKALVRLVDGDADD